MHAHSIHTALRWLAALVFTLVSFGSAFAQTAADSATRLRIVGGLGGGRNYLQHEEPFWTRDLARLSGGRASAEIVPFDRAGIRGPEMLRLVQLGAVPFGTLILNLGAQQDEDLAMADLAGLNPDIQSLERNVAVLRPYLAAVLRERYGAELLATYTYPAQVTFCTKPMGSLADLSGRRVRISSATQADFVVAFGGTPVRTAFAEVMTNLRAGNVDCVITGTMTGNALGLHELTSHVHSMPVNWGLAVFVANRATWLELPADLRALLERELPRLERAVWQAAAADTGEGIACNIGAAACVNGRKGRMTEVRETAADERRRREVLASHVLPRWQQRCGATCTQAWQRTLGPALGIELR